MKTNNLIKFFFIFIMLISTLTSCVEDSQYDTPTIKNPNCDNPTLVATTTIQAIKKLASESIFVKLHKFTSEDIVEGYVVSSDKSGNIFKSIYIQDKPENPEHAIVIHVDEYDTHVRYQIGTKVMIKLNGLAVMDNFGTIELGVQNGSDLEPIPAELVRKQILVSCVPKVVIVPKKLKISEIKDSHLGMLVQIDNMQLTKANHGYPYAGITSSGYSRNFETVDDLCYVNGTIIMRTSKYADFALTPIPVGKGSVVGLLTEFSNAYQLFIRDTNDVKLVNPVCVPPVSVTMIEENFENFALSNGYTASGQYPLTLIGWTNSSASGSVKWVLDKLSTNAFAMFQATSSPVGNYIGWLITPQLDMDQQYNESLSFNIQKLTVAGSQTELELYFSSNWDGTESGISTATWNTLPLTYPTVTSTNSLNTLNLSQLTGKIHLAYKYNGTSANRTKWRVDDIKLLGLK